LPGAHSAFGQEQWDFPELVRFVQDSYGSEATEETETEVGAETDADAEAEGGLSAIEIPISEEEEGQGEEVASQKDGTDGAVDSDMFAGEALDQATDAISDLAKQLRSSYVMGGDKRFRFLSSDQKDSYEVGLAMKYKKVPHNLWVTLLKALCRNRESRTAINLLNWIRKHRFKVFYDDLFAVIIDGLGRNERFSEALSFAEQLEMKGYQTYDALIKICWKAKEYSRLLIFVKKVRQAGMRPDHVHYTFALQACIRKKLPSQEIMKLYEHMLEDRIHFDEKLYNDVTYAVAGSADAEQSLRLLKDMKNGGFVPNATVYTFIMFALCHSGRMNEAHGILMEMKGYGRLPNLRTYNTLIKGYARKGQLDLAEEVMRTCMVEDNVEPNEQTYSILIDYRVNAGELEKAWSLFQEMEGNGLRPDAFIYGRLMTAFKGAGRWLSAMKTLSRMEEEGIRPNRHVYNIAIDTFGKHRKAEKAREIFVKMRSEGIEPDVVTWNSLIECHFRAGETRKALQIFASMKSEGLKPSSHTYNIVIDYLGRLRLWKDLKSILDDMKRSGLVANTITYTTLVDVYGQSRRFQDAFECLEMMRTQSTKPEPSVYCALANAYARQVYVLFCILVCVCYTFVQSPAFL
jgi:pentatricopeptide repeat protein